MCALQNHCKYASVMANAGGSSVLKWCIFVLRNRRIMYMVISTTFNTIRPRQNVRYVADDIFIYIFLKENMQLSI